MVSGKCWVMKTVYLVQGDKTKRLRGGVSTAEPQKGKKHPAIVNSFNNKGRFELHSYPQV